MARICELCKKKVGINDSCAPIYFVQQPYSNVFGTVSVPSSFSCFLCVDCMRATNYLFSYKWAGKQDSKSHYEIDNSNKCTNEEMISAQEYVKSRFANISDNSYKAFYILALDMTNRIIKRRSEFSQIKNDIIQKLEEALEKRNQQKPQLLSELNASDSKYTENSTVAYRTADELVLCGISYNDLMADEDSAKRFVKSTKSSLDSASPMESIEDKIDEDDLLLIDIPIRRYRLNNIKYYKTEGSEQYLSNVHGGGGGGGGANVSGAVVGGLLFGAAGAIIGSQVGTEVKINPVVTDIIKRDGRYIRLIYDNNGTVQEFYYSADMIKAFTQLIPEKEYGTVMLDATSNNAPTSVKQETPQPADKKAVNVVEELRQYKSLLDEGIITQEEFDNKKKELLSL